MPEYFYILKEGIYRMQAKIMNIAKVQLNKGSGGLYKARGSLHNYGGSLHIDSVNIRNRKAGYYPAFLFLFEANQLLNNQFFGPYKTIASDFYKINTFGIF
jgi:hypothetical protein